MKPTLALCAALLLLATESPAPAATLMSNGAGSFEYDPGGTHAPASILPDLPSLKAFFQQVVGNVSLSDGSTFPNVLNAWTQGFFVNFDTVLLGPGALSLEINDAQAQIALNAALGGLEISIQIIRNSDSAVVLQSTGPATFEVYDLGNDVGFGLVFPHATDIEAVGLTHFGGFGNTSESFSFAINAVPEPSRALLSLAGVAAIGLRRRR